MAARGSTLCWPRWCKRAEVERRSPGSVAHPGCKPGGISRASSIGAAVPYVRGDKSKPTLLLLNGTSEASVDLTYNDIKFDFPAGRYSQARRGPDLLGHRSRPGTRTGQASIACRPLASAANVGLRQPEKTRPSRPRRRTRSLISRAIVPADSPGSPTFSSLLVTI